MSGTPEIRERIAGFDWERVASELDERGHARLPRLLLRIRGEPPHTPRPYRPARRNAPDLPDPGISIAAKRHEKSQKI